MDKKVIKINESQIREMVTKAVKRVLNENATPETLRDELYDIWYELNTLCDTLSHTYKDFEDSDESSDLAFATKRVGDLVRWLDKGNNQSVNFPLGDTYGTFGYSSLGLSAYGDDDDM